MKERPILFSGPMVRAILEGRKTVTRRVMKPQRGSALLVDGGGQPFTQRWDESEQMNWRRDIECPFGEPGDRLWVRETWRAFCRSWVEEGGSESSDCRAYYLADGSERAVDPPNDWAVSDRLGFIPSIHMPRWASRLTLEITGVRVQRLQEISEEDAEAERARLPPDHPPIHGNFRCVQVDMETGKALGSPKYGAAFGEFDPCRLAFSWLWDSLAKPGATWADNPWVWVIEFRRIP